MRFDNIVIEDKVKEKILSKHNIQADELKRVLLNEPLILKTKHDRYIAIGKDERYITIIFESKKEVTIIITAYTSSQAQTKLYKKKGS